MADILHVECDLARHDKALDPHARSTTFRIVDLERAGFRKLPPRDNVAVKLVEDSIRVKDRQDLGHRVDGEELALAQADRARDVVDVGVGEHHGADGRRPQRPIDARL